MCIRDSGVSVAVDGKRVLLGNEKLMKQQNISYTTCKSRGTVIYVAVNGSFAGSIVISDRIKEGAREAIASMKKIGVKRCVMLTGDRKEAAEQDVYKRQGSENRIRNNRPRCGRI